jgi:hypothetical protein
VDRTEKSKTSGTFRESNVRRPARSLVTISTELSRLSLQSKSIKFRDNPCFVTSHSTTRGKFRMARCVTKCVTLAISRDVTEWAEGDSEWGYMLSSSAKLVKMHHGKLSKENAR